MGPLYSYYVSCAHELTALVKAETNAVTRNGIHQLRVIIKKLKAVFTLLEHLDPRFDSKRHIDRMKPLFAAAGKVRDLDIAISVLGSIAPKSIHDELHAVQEQKVHDLLELVKDEKFDILLPTDEVASVCATGRNEGKHIRTFLSLVGQQMSNDLSQGLKKNQLHDTRNRLKEFFYIAEMVHDIRVNEKPLSQLLPEIEMIQHQLGKWHDLVIAISRVKKLSGSKQAHRKKLVRSLKEREKKKRAAVMKRISKSEVFSYLSHLE
jgi:CHAD domain-containing protein